MNSLTDGPCSPRFRALAIDGNTDLADLAGTGLSETGTRQLPLALSGACVCWGIAFRIERVALARGAPVTVRWPAAVAPWFVTMHTTDVEWPERNAHGFFPHPRGQALLKQRVADYVWLYADGSERRERIFRQHQIGMLLRGWGQNCFQAVAHQKPYPIRTLTEQPGHGIGWGGSQTRVVQPDSPGWVNWLWAWRNPEPEKPVAGLRIEPVGHAIVLSAISAGDVSDLPLRWEARRKAVLTLPDGVRFQPSLGPAGLLEHLQLDLGQVISATPRTVYPNARWERTPNNWAPEVSARELLVEYTAHPDACFHLPGGATVPVSALRDGPSGALRPVSPATQRVRLRVVEKGSGRPVPVKLHVHGEAGEYLPPVDRHRIPNSMWYEDWSVDYVSPPHHNCTYIPGETTIDLPLGRVYVEISKGFEIAPVRKSVRVTRGTMELSFELERVLPWRARGWVTADTHVHFLSPPSAHLEGAAEGVNVVNLLASQWGELMTNVGDYDGRTTWGSREAGGDGEHLVRVGTENRQHVLGHISLLGYNGPMIAPMTTGGPDESAIGDPVDILLTEWARQCRAQGGLVILPHFPNPRAEHAAAILSGEIDGVEMTSWMNLYAGIDPYSLSDWYRYLNCGRFVAAVGGTDKMAASTAVGAIRTYARLPEGRAFDHDAWKEAVRSGHTFVTYGPLMEFSVEGKPAGSRLALGRGGGTLAVDWRLASCTVPMTRLDLIVNGEIRESRSVDPREAAGTWNVRVDRSSWLALLVRGHYAGKPEMIAAHSSPVMASVEGSRFFSAADALTILEQVEGAIAYLDTVGTRAQTAAYRRMRLLLTGVYRNLHNELHRAGHFHEHTASTDHPEHHR
ncbi:MAG TPA: CehA/McbA family metallohydrolase [Chthonomonadales bacterium]|nr:CehA/McbA family metallohydrolase [Chthonomonadales bacterium]